MAKLKFSYSSSNLGVYSKYKNWLDQNHYFNICGYCITDHDKLEIDHFEPQTMSGSMGDHPSNLLLSCPGCNGRAGKSDYHPKHKARTRFKKHKFKVINVRKDDYSKLFIIRDNGEIFPRKGKNLERAIHNILLLKLDRKSLNNVRKDYFTLLASASQLQSIVKSQKDNSQAKNCLTRILDQLNRIELFFRVYDVKLNREINRSLKSKSQRASSLP